MGTLGDDEAIFAIDIIKDGGAKGRLTFVGRVYEMIRPKAEHLSQVMPRIEHFVKHASDSFFYFKYKHKNNFLSKSFRPKSN